MSSGPEDEQTQIERAFLAARPSWVPASHVGRFESLETVTDAFASLLTRTGLEPDDVVADRYRIERLLGSGVMGQVYLARHVAISLEVAIKLIRPELLQQPELRQRFHREAQAVASIHHPNVARFFDLVLGDPSALVMEYVPGPTLEEELARVGRMSSAEALDLAIPIAWALEAVHAAGILHRDLKPANVILTPVPGGGRVPKIVDFGIAKVIPAGGEDEQKLTRVGELVGTFLYMAPEQFTGEATARSDVYALGTMIYEMVAGRGPFPPFDNSMQAYFKKAHETPPPLRAHAPAAPAALEAELARALASSAGERHATMAELARALEAVRSPPPPPQVRPPPDLRMLVVGVALGGCLGALLTLLALR